MSDGGIRRKPMYSKSGVWPVRKRAYHRALKRGEEWAVELSRKPGIQWAMSWVYHNTMVNFDFSEPSKLLELIKPSPAWSGGYISFPIGSDDEST